MSNERHVYQVEVVFKIDDRKMDWVTIPEWDDLRATGMVAPLGDDRDMLYLYTSEVTAEQARQAGLNARQIAVKRVKEVISRKVVIYSETVQKIAV